MDPVVWFIHGHDSYQYPGSKETNGEGYWMPSHHLGKITCITAPADAFTANMLLRKARKKRQQSTHMFIVPRSMTPLWQKQLLKASDIVLVLKPGHPSWPVEMLEPLTMAVCYPYISHILWEVRRYKALLELRRSVQEE